jgi:hypothetical protein
MYKIKFINFDYYSANTPDTLEEAKKVVRQAGFQSAVEKDGYVVGSYCPMVGWRDYK